MQDAYDLVIIGGGAAGLIAAPFAVQLGARVAFVETNLIYCGDCHKKTHHRCYDDGELITPI